MIKMLGAVFIIVGCSAVGFIMAGNLSHEITAVRNLIANLEYWKNAIGYHHTTLPELCMLSHTMDKTVIGDYFRKLGEQLDKLGEIDATQCTVNALSLCPEMPHSCRILLQTLGRGLGKFDMDGQLHEIDAVLEDARNTLSTLLSSHDSRLKCYKTLGICTGVAIAILIV